ncbi:aminopeptidase P family protein [Lichenicola cladoniae]|uniref:Aminopeptidase P family protein n=1 Tax=Lichenicola cladoniae TaxID=1484109 RepID=A0A6M8HNH7_9PROT|nr:aminopeptidase P family protein [Lichenicola cladoniae]NPD67336.1 aminopeptidase P family protein [Acetobacteraceae bacterium]QKE89837.1 aminopeptidase P family protein [Lichenicola cladoniae]
MTQTRSNTAAHLAALRAELAEQGVDGFILPRGDEHLGEYVAPYAERLAWLTGFTGSAGVAIVLPGTAAVFSDGRYVLQLASQVEEASYQRLHLTLEPPETWLAETATAAIAGRAARIGYDPWLLGSDALARYSKPGLELVALSRNPVDAVWTDRPLPPRTPALPHAIEFAGRSSQEKRQEIALLLRDAGEDAVMLTDPASIAWLFNIRGRDVDFTPMALGFALLSADETATLFMAPEQLPAETLRWLGNSVSVQPPEAIAPALAGLVDRRVRLDPAGAAAWFAQTLRTAGATISAAPDPCLLPKARKNAVEQQGSRNAHRRDGIALCQFLHFVAGRGIGRSETELSGQLDAFRSQAPDYRGESFPAISGTGPNGAIIHYRADPATARRLQADEVYLIDSGGQYPDGTTDVTRTIWSGPGAAPSVVRDHATRVLQGHIALARARFPAGVHGGRLDAFARAALWQAGLDYDHGTGHGIGSYLAVHEGPCGISATARPIPIEAGMILSDEPGYYLPGAYGMRVENLLLVQVATFDGPPDSGRDASRRFLEFDTLTLAPFDRALIEPALLAPADIEWIDRYHARVLREIGPGLPGPVRDWLAGACAPLDPVSHDQKEL